MPKTKTDRTGVSLGIPQTIGGIAVDRFPWERQPSESEKAYAAFVLYRDQTPPRRLADVVQALNKSKALIGRWSSRYGWIERASHFDANVERSRSAERDEARREMNARHATIAKAMSAKVAQRINALQPEELSPGELGRWMQVIAMVERLALGEATERTERTGDPDTVSLTVEDNRTLVVQPDTQRMAEVLARLQARQVIDVGSTEEQPKAPESPGLDPETG